jgi:competence protein ComEA
MIRTNGSSVRKFRPALDRPTARPWLIALVLGVVALAGPAWAAAPAARSGAGSGVTVNINAASAEELQALPGIGEARASQIVALRKERGAFRKVEELLEVRGIGPAMLERLRPQVSLSGRTQLGETPASEKSARKPDRKSPQKGGR